MLPPICRLLVRKWRVIGRGAFARNQSRLKHLVLKIRREGGPCNQIKKHGNGDTSYLVDRLAHCGQSRVYELSEKHVVKADNG